MLWLYQRTFYGELTLDANRRLPDATMREKVSLFPLVAMAIIMGLFSPYWMQAIDPSSREVNKARVAAMQVQRTAPETMTRNSAPPAVQSQVPIPQPPITR